MDVDVRLRSLFNSHCIQYFRYRQYTVVTVTGRENHIFVRLTVQLFRNKCGPN